MVTCENPNIERVVICANPKPIQDDAAPIYRCYDIPRRTGWASSCSPEERRTLAAVVRRARRGEIQPLAGIDVNQAILGAVRMRCLAHLKRLARAVEGKA